MLDKSQPGHVALIDDGDDDPDRAESLRLALKRKHELLVRAPTDAEASAGSYFAADEK